MVNLHVLPGNIRLLTVLNVMKIYLIYDLFLQIHCKRV